MSAQLFAPFGTPGGRFDGEEITVPSILPERISIHCLVWERDGFLSDGKTPRYSIPGHGCKFPLEGAA